MLYDVLLLKVNFKKIIKDIHEIVKNSSEGLQGLYACTQNMNNTFLKSKKLYP